MKIDIKTKMSKNFTVEEFLHSNTLVYYNAEHEDKIVNDFTPVTYRNACLVTNLIAQPIHDYYGEAVYVTSGQRVKELNKLVGGADDSYHIYGLAVDLLVSAGESGQYIDCRQVFNDIVLGRITLNGAPIMLFIDKIIIEQNSDGDVWLHIQIAKMGKEPRMQKYKAREIKGRIMYIPTGIFRELEVIKEAEGDADEEKEKECSSNSNSIE